MIGREYSKAVLEALPSEERAKRLRHLNDAKEDDLLLRSEFPVGIRLAWKNYDELSDDDDE